MVQFIYYLTVLEVRSLISLKSRGQQASFLLEVLRENPFLALSWFVVPPHLQRQQLRVVDRESLRALSLSLIVTCTTIPDTQKIKGILTISSSSFAQSLLPKNLTYSQVPRTSSVWIPCGGHCGPSHHIQLFIFTELLYNASKIFPRY